GVGGPFRAVIDLDHAIGRRRTGILERADVAPAAGGEGAGLATLVGLNLARISRDDVPRLAVGAERVGRRRTAVESQRQQVDAGGGDIGVLGEDAGAGRGGVTQVVAQRLDRAPVCTAGIRPAATRED